MLLADEPVQILNENFDMVRAYRKIMQFAKDQQCVSFEELCESMAKTAPDGLQYLLENPAVFKLVAGNFEERDRRCRNKALTAIANNIRWIH